ncbi:MAG: tetratricopeptide repeat protein, partial [Alkalimonas sp.]|nr:tetratricopeptide repeat protein [Alkalimonas sp.]
KENQQATWLSDAEQYIAAHERTSYAQFAAMMKARDAVMQGEYGLAEQQLSWVIANSKDKVIKTIARLRLARVHLQQEQGAQALAVLEAPVPASFKAQQQELMGDIQLALGDAEAAKRAYLMARSSDGSESNQLLKIKLDELAHVHVEGNL